jgi:trans-aconitate 2-methyltransferase
MLALDMTNDAWDPDQYARFQRERRQPWEDLVALLHPCSRPRVVDLGCGDGALTRELHQRLGARETVGVDSSPAMLEKAAPLAGDGLRFVLGDAGAWSGGPYDLVFSNAALHWVPDHPAWWPKLAALVAPGGQLAVQVPVNDHHPSHAEARAVAASSEFSADLAGHLRQSPVLEPEWYATALHRLGFLAPRVRVEVYTHLLDSRDAVVEWVRGSVLTDYQRRLDAPAWERFLERYRARLAAALPDLRPFPYTYRRLFIAARRP